MGRLLRDEIGTDATADLLAQDDPVLESADFPYGDISTVKENDALSLNAYWNETQNPTMQLEVKINARSFLSSPVDWSLEAALLWTMQLIHEWLTYPVKYGKVLRFRFRGVNARGLKFDAFEEKVRAKQAEQ